MIVEIPEIYPKIFPIITVFEPEAGTEDMVGVVSPLIADLVRLSLRSRCGAEVLELLKLSTNSENGISDTWEIGWSKALGIYKHLA